MRHKPFRHSVIDAARVLAEHARGTAEGFQVEDLEAYAEWLEWKLCEGWDDRSSGTEHFTHYDSLVRMMAAEALDLYKYHRDR